jgi:tetratricopeptide (TPR) repeat protein
VAALRSRFDVAIAAYLEATGIAPDRPLPHASIGGILLRTGRADEAADAYDRALALGPRDEAALRGRADAMIALNRPYEAAESLDRLADVLDGSGRVADACDAARRALELAESKDRRRQVESLVGRLRVSAGDEKAERSLARALRILEPPVVEEVAVAEADGVAIEGADAGASEVPEAPAPEATVESAQPEPLAAAEPTVEAEPLPEPVEAEPLPEPVEAEPLPEPVEAEPLPEPVEAEPLPEPVDGNLIGAAAEEALAAGDHVAAREGLLAAAAAHRSVGRSVAAIDACYLALAIAPDDVDLHLLLAELYLERGWRAPAADKLVLLGRLASLADDSATRERICRLASQQLADEPRLTELCA